MPDKQLLAALHEQPKIDQIRADLKLDDDKNDYSLKGINPTMKMEIEDAGHAAQMQVIDLSTGHAVASMEYLKDTNEFVFSLSDPATGTSKAEFEIKPDGKAYIGGAEVSVVTTNDEEGDEPVFNDVAEMPVAVTRITRSECMKGFRILELDWQRDTVYFIKDNSGDEKYLYLIKYRALGAVDQDTAGAFWVERLTEAL